MKNFNVRKILVPMESAFLRQHFRQAFGDLSSRKAGSHCDCCVDWNLLQAISPGILYQEHCEQRTLPGFEYPARYGGGKLAFTVQKHAAI